MGPRPKMGALKARNFLAQAAVKGLGKRLRPNGIAKQLSALHRGKTRRVQQCARKSAEVPPSGLVNPTTNPRSYDAGPRDTAPSALALERFLSWCIRQSVPSAVADGYSALGGRSTDSPIRDRERC